MRGVVLGAVVLASALACTAPSSAEPQPEAQPEPQPEAEDPDTREARAWLAAYRRGEVVARSDDPLVAFVASSDDPCRPMPAARPPEMQLTYWLDPYESIAELYYGVVGPEPGACRIERDMLHLPDPRGACTVLDDARADALWAELRGLELWTIESVREPNKPHTVGRALRLRWSGSRCELLHIDGVASVTDADYPRFAAAVDAFTRAFERAD